jgi:hypothetical protein
MCHRTIQQYTCITQTCVTELGSAENFNKIYIIKPKRNYTLKNSTQIKCSEMFSPRKHKHTLNLLKFRVSAIMQSTAHHSRDAAPP